MMSGRPETNILMLHRILPEHPAAFGLPGCYRLRGTALTVEELGRVLEAVGPILPLEAVEAALGRGEEPPTGSVLTFDDGYREHLDVVAPLLTARGATATFYVATGLHGAGDDVAVVDVWYWLLDHACRGEAAVPLPDGGVFRGRVDTAEAKAVWVGGVPKTALLNATHTEQRQMLEALSESTGCELPVDLAARLYLRREEWAVMAAHGMRVGAHSVHHSRLTQVDDQMLRREVNASVSTIGELCSPVAFAYPDGAFDARVVDAVRAGGVSSSVTCEAGPVRRGADRLRLTRTFVRPADVPTRP
ncbi:MAG: hypothetical protein ACI8RZ_006851 [Myxococcota bacterium]|jgi:hypothetical protein